MACSRSASSLRAKSGTELDNVLLRDLTESISCPKANQQAGAAQARTPWCVDHSQGGGGK